MKTAPKRCADCNVDMRPIKLIDATESGRGGSGVTHVDLAYAAADAESSFFGSIPRLGTVRGMICPRCGQIKLYGEKDAF